MFTVCHRCLYDCLYELLAAIAVYIKWNIFNVASNKYTHSDKCYHHHVKMLDRSTVLVKMTAYIIIITEKKKHIWKMEKWKTLSSVYQFVATFKFPCTHFFLGDTKYKRHSEICSTHKVKPTERRKFELIQSPIWNSWFSEDVNCVCMITYL